MHSFDGVLYSSTWFGSIFEFSCDVVFLFLFSQTFDSCGFFGGVKLKKLPNLLDLLRVSLFGLFEFSGLSGANKFDKSIGFSFFTFGTKSGKIVLLLF